MARAGRTTIALVTCAEYPGLAPDDLPLAAALGRRGLHPTPERWDDRGVAWADHGAVVIRSCWDYHHRAAEFEAWLDRLERCGAAVHNPVPTLRWNMRKTYLRDLEAAGLRVAGTVWAARGSATSLSQIAADTGWTAMVVKPTVSASGWQTWRVEHPGIPDGEQRFARLLAERDLMVQPFLPDILTEGETSCVFLAGRFSHAVRKRAKPGEFRVQEEHGGTAERDLPEPALVAEAARALTAVPTATLYARVDGVETRSGFVITEVELIEPMLYFGWDEDAAHRMAAALERIVAGEGKAG
jgi:hypothetical protein